MNILEGRIEAGSFRYGDMMLPLRRHRRPRPGARRSTASAPSTSTSPPDGVPAEVIVIEPTGPETQVVAKLGAQEITCVFKERLQARPGEILKVKPDPALVHLFDKESGRRAN